MAPGIAAVDDDGAEFAGRADAEVSKDYRATVVIALAVDPEELHRADRRSRCRPVDSNRAGLRGAEACIHRIDEGQSERIAFDSDGRTGAALNRKLARDNRQRPDIGQRASAVAELARSAGGAAVALQAVKQDVSAALEVAADAGAADLDDQAGKRAPKHVPHLEAGAGAVAALSTSTTAQATAAPAIDPVFGLIDAYEKARAAHLAALEEQSRLEKIPGMCRAAWSVSEKPCCDENDAFEALITGAATTLPGVRAKLAYLQELAASEESGWQFDEHEGTVNLIKSFGASLDAMPQVQP
jgi:hypothetical protein